MSRLLANPLTKTTLWREPCIELGLEIPFCISNRGDSMARVYSFPAAGNLWFLEGQMQRPESAQRECDPFLRTPAIIIIFQSATVAPVLIGFRGGYGSSVIQSNLSSPKFWNAIASQVSFEVLLCICNPAVWTAGCWSLCDWSSRADVGVRKPPVAWRPTWLGEERGCTFSSFAVLPRRYFTMLFASGRGKHADWGVAFRLVRLGQKIHESLKSSKRIIGRVRSSWTTLQMNMLLLTIRLSPSHTCENIQVSILSSFPQQIPFTQRVLPPLTWQLLLISHISYFTMSSYPSSTHPNKGSVDK
jgi:hypothetical protein